MDSRSSARIDMSYFGRNREILEKMLYHEGDVESLVLTGFWQNLAGSKRCASEAGQVPGLQFGAEVALVWVNTLTWREGRV
ncbi:hypothetical protein [Salinisphaera hydrothermalis]|uniref:hypothetical protein n=1 Tax=Salinisphaera hydrothermalis TaxID=563188 RepID=UPI003341A872